MNRKFSSFKSCLVEFFASGAVCPCGQVAFIARINKTLFMKMVELSKQLTSDFSKDKFGFPGVSI